MTGLLSLLRRVWGRVTDPAARPRSTALAAAVLLAGVLLVAGLRACRPTPAAVERQATTDVHQVVTAERQEQAATVRHVETRSERRPDGTVTVVRVEDSRRDSAARSSTAATVEVREVVREVVKPSPPPAAWRAELRAGWHPADLGAELRATPPVLGASLSRRVAGPLWVGAWAERDAGRYVAGLSVAMEW